MKRVCLIEPAHRTGYGFQYLPLGLLSLAGVLRYNGYSVSVHYGNSVPKCDFLGISASSLQYRDAIGIARNSVSSTTVIGGAHPTTSPADTLRSCAFDYAIIGDGELAFLNLLLGKKIETIPGLVWRSNGTIVVNPNEDVKYGLRYHREELRRAMLPAYDLFDAEIGPHVGISRCREWSWKFGWKRKNRPRYWRDFNKEVESLNSIGVKEVTILDENFGSWSGKMRATITALDTFDAWHCRSNARTVIDTRLDQALVGSNCKTVEIVARSGSPRLLREYKLPSTGENELAGELLAGAGIEVVYNMTLGLPGETVGSLRETQAWLAGKRARVERVLPLPGTPYYDNPANFSAFGYRIIEHDFSSYAERLVWRMDTIASETFTEIEKEICKEFNNGRSNVN